MLNPSLVLECAKKYKNRADFDYIEAAGLYGLSEAIKRYQFDIASNSKKQQPKSRAQFGTYAVDWINKEIKKYLKNNAYAYSINAGQKDINPVLRKIFDEIEEENRKDPGITISPTYEEVSKRYEERTKRKLSLEAFDTYVSLKDSSFSRF